MVQYFNSLFKEDYLTQCCGKIPTPDDADDIRQSIIKYQEEQAQDEAHRESIKQVEEEIAHSREQQKIHKNTFQRSLPQQNMKDESGDHYFYDPRNSRSGVAFGDSPRKDKDEPA